MSRCNSRVLLRERDVFRCMFETGDGHTEHQYNYYRRLTDAEAQEVRALDVIEEKGITPNRET